MTMNLVMTVFMTFIKNMSMTMTVSFTYAVTRDLRLITIDEPSRQGRSCDGDVVVTMTMTHKNDRDLMNDFYYDILELLC